MLPDLDGGLQLGALLDAAQANDDGRSVLGRSAVQGCSALRTERLYAAIAALRDLDVAPGLTTEHKAFDGRRDHSASVRTGLYVGKKTTVILYCARNALSCTVMNGALCPLQLSTTRMLLGCKKPATTAEMTNAA